jgi:hypothetical protein
MVLNKVVYTLSIALKYVGGLDSYSIEIGDVFSNGLNEGVIVRCTYNSIYFALKIALWGPNLNVNEFVSYVIKCVIDKQGEIDDFLKLGE